jgi:hypothetical protein
MSVLHVVYRIDIQTELQPIIDHLYANNTPLFYQILRKDINELLTNIPGSSLEVISSGVIIKDNIIQAHIFAMKQGNIVNEDVTNLAQSFNIIPKLEFAVNKCGNVQRYQVQLKLNFTFINGFLNLEYPLKRNLD